MIIIRPDVGLGKVDQGRFATRGRPRTLTDGHSVRARTVYRGPRAVRLWSGRVIVAVVHPVSSGVISTRM